jgi:hypothetical protein
MIDLAEKHISGRWQPWHWRCHSAQHYRAGGRVSITTGKNKKPRNAWSMKFNRVAGVPWPITPTSLKKRLWKCSGSGRGGTGAAAWLGRVGRDF